MIQRPCDIKLLEGIRVLEQCTLTAEDRFLCERDWMQWRSQVFSNIPCLRLVNDLKRLNEDYGAGWGRTLLRHKAADFRVSSICSQYESTFGFITQFNLLSLFSFHY